MEVLKRYWPRNAWAQAAALVLLTFLVLAFVSFLFGDFCGQQKENCYGDYASNNVAYVAIARLIFLTEDYNALITAVATALLTIITYYLWSLEREASATNKAQLRAYLSAQPKGMVMDGDDLIVLVRVQNAGQTPAFNVRIPAVWQLKPPPPHTFLVSDMGLTDEHLDSLGVSTLPKDGFRTIGPKCKIVDMKGFIEDAKLACFYVFGVITYQDVFGDYQWVEFCFFLEPPVFLKALDRALQREPDNSPPFKIPTFGNDTSFNPENAEAMENFRG